MSALISVVPSISVLDVCDGYSAIGRVLRDGFVFDLRQLWAALAFDVVNMLTKMSPISQIACECVIFIKYWVNLNDPKPMLELRRLGFLLTPGGTA